MKRYISLCLMLLMLFWSVVTCTHANDVVPPETTVPIETMANETTMAVEDTSLLLDESRAPYVLVYPDESSGYTMKWVTKIQTSLRERSAIRISVRNDATSAASDACEILVGETNRPESAEVLASIGPNDFAIRQIGRKVVIAAHNCFKLYEAIDYFLAQSVTVAEDGAGKKTVRYVGDHHAQNESGVTSEITCMSVNVLNGSNNTYMHTLKRQPILLGKIKEELPDVIVFQEFDPIYRDFESFTLGLETAGYTEVPVIDTVKNSEKCWNPIFYQTEKLTLLDCGYVRYDVRHESLRDGKETGARSISWAILEDNVSHSRFAVMSTHLDTDQVEGNRTKQIEQVLAWIPAFKAEHGIENVIFAGDLNCVCTTPEFGLLLEGGFTDTHDIALEVDDLGTYGTIGTEINRTYAQTGIDHFLMMSENMKVLEYRTVTDIRDATDHCPIILRVQFN